MDQTLSLKLEQFKKALNSLKFSLEEERDDLVRDSVIKRFEYTYELCWKTAKLFLNDQFGEDIFSPKACFRTLRKNKLISDEETESLLQMIDDRNQGIHTYNEIFADKFYDDIKNSYYDLMEKIYNQIRLAR